MVPARGGSRGIPRKNVRPLAGRPLLWYTAAVAQESRLLSRVVLSSDDVEVMALGRQLGLDVPFARPAELATDAARSVDVVLHAVSWLATEQRDEYDVIALLEPTSPLRTAEDIDGPLTRLLEEGADAVATVTRVVAPHPMKMQIVEGGRLRPLMPGFWRDGVSRQALPPVFAFNGALYAIRREVLERSRTLLPPDTLAYEIPAERAVNLDSPLDWTLAEGLLARTS